MFVGALVDAGAPLNHLERELANIPVKGYRLRKKKVRRCGIGSTKVDVVVERKEADKARKWTDIEHIIRSSKIEDEIKRQGLKLFKGLFQAEAKVHGRRVGTVHLHELGAVDCIVDVFSVLIGLSYLGIERIYASPVNLGSGVTVSEHGALPVPAPATLELLKNGVVYSTKSDFELTTPTGALLVSRLAEGFGDIPRMKVLGYGHGAGDKDLPTSPNVLRIFIGETGEHQASDEIYLVETNIDDMDPRYYDHVMDLLFKASALDVFMTPLYMKKQRPAVKLSVILHEDNLNEIIDIIMRETTSLGVRFNRYKRVVLKREYLSVKTEFGAVRCKKVFRDSGTHEMYPEYDDCKAIAEKTGLPIGEVFEMVKRKCE